MNASSPGTSTSHEEHTVYGVRYPSGRVEWNLLQWFGDLSTEESRQQFTEHYQAQLEALGVPSAGPLVFLKRTDVLTHGAPQELSPDPSISETNHGAS